MSLKNSHNLIEEYKVSFDALMKLYFEYNSHTNISAIRTKDEVYEKHFLDSLFLLDKQTISDASAVLDLGSGGGFPVLPLAIVLPKVSFTALDATAKKTKFIELVKEKLKLQNLEILTTRAEDLAYDKNYREKFDFVTARAVSELNMLLELSSGFICDKGVLFAYKARDIDEEEKRSLSAQKKTNLKLESKQIISDCKQILKFVKHGKLDASLPRLYSQIKSKPL